MWKLVLCVASFPFFPLFQYFFEKKNKYCTAQKVSSSAFKRFQCALRRLLQLYDTYCPNKQQEKVLPFCPQKYRELKDGKWTFQMYKNIKKKQLWAIYVHF